DAHVVAITQIGRGLAGVVRLDALTGDLECLERRPVDRLIGGGDFFPGDPQTGGRWIEPVETARIIDDSTVAFLAHARYHLGDNGADFFGNLTLRGQQFGEKRFKIAISRREPDGHAMSFLIVVAWERECLPGRSGI